MPLRPAFRAARCAPGPSDETDCMNERRAFRQFPYRRSPDQDARAPVRHPVVVVGAGPVGLCAAIDLAQRGVPVVLLDDADRIGEGSRGICYAKRTLEILDRLGVAERCLEQGRHLEARQGLPARRAALSRSISCPRTGTRCRPSSTCSSTTSSSAWSSAPRELADVDMRWRNKVSGLEHRNDGARLTIETPDGPYRLDADWVIAADGARSTAAPAARPRVSGRRLRGPLPDRRRADGRRDFPTERRFWFDPPFHDGRSALLHKQPDDVWRIDLQLGPDADPIAEQKPERVIPRLRQMLGADTTFALEWVSVYTFHCRRLERFVHGRVIFAGDAAHQVSPFGARGGNSGIQDAENLAWKLAARAQGRGAGEPDRELRPRALGGRRREHRPLDPLDRFHRPALGRRSCAFATPRWRSRAQADFAKRMVNSGRLSVPASTILPLSTPDATPWAGTARLGAPLPDAPLLDRAGQAGVAARRGRRRGERPSVREPDGDASPPAGLKRLVIGEDLIDRDGLFAHRFDATPGAQLSRSPRPAPRRALAGVRRRAIAAAVAPLQRPADDGASDARARDRHPLRRSRPGLPDADRRPSRAVGRGKRGAEHAASC